MVSLSFSNTGDRFLACTGSRQPKVIMPLLLICTTLVLGIDCWLGLNLGVWQGWLGAASFCIGWCLYSWYGMYIVITPQAQSHLTTKSFLFLLGDLQPCYYLYYLIWNMQTKTKGHTQAVTAGQWHPEVRCPATHLHPSPSLMCDLEIILFSLTQYGVVHHIFILYHSLTISVLMLMSSTSLRQPPIYWLIVFIISLWRKISICSSLEILF